MVHYTNWSFLLLEGSKKMIRWAQWSPPMPLLNFETDAVSFPIISFITGLLLFYSGYLFLKLIYKGILISALILILDLITTILHWNRWDEFAKLEVISRKKYQGLPIDNK